jgi:hypothetical protein
MPNPHISPENSTPEKKVYTPKGAIRAMLAGKILKNREGWDCFWDKHFNMFFAKEPGGTKRYSIGNFIGLYEVLA